MRVICTRLLFWADGMTLAPSLVLIHPRGLGDVGLLAHEAVHCRQMRDVGMLRFWWHYLTCPAFRLWAEIEAYRVSLVHQPRAVRNCARALAYGYLLDISLQEAERLLLGPEASGSSAANPSPAR